METEYLYYGTQELLPGAVQAVPESLEIFCINIHIIINILIVILAVVLWKGNIKIQKEIKEDQPWEYYQLLWKLKHILDGPSEKDIFIIAAKEKGFVDDYLIDADFKRYLESGAEVLPVYVKEFLDAGREMIINAKVNRWIL